MNRGPLTKEVNHYALQELACLLIGIVAGIMLARWTGGRCNYAIPVLRYTAGVVIGFGVIGRLMILIVVYDGKMPDR